MKAVIVDSVSAVLAPLLGGKQNEGGISWLNRNIYGGTPRADVLMPLQEQSVHLSLWPSHVGIPKLTS